MFTCAKELDLVRVFFSHFRNFLANDIRGLKWIK